MVALDHQILLPALQNPFTPCVWLFVRHVNGEANVLADILERVGIINEPASVALLDPHTTPKAFKQRDPLVELFVVAFGDPAQANDHREEDQVFGGLRQSALGFAVLFVVEETDCFAVRDVRYVPIQ